MLLQCSGYKREPQKKNVARFTENEAGTNAVSGPKGEDHTKKHLEEENLHHRREKPQISRDEQCLQGRNIFRVLVPTNALFMRHINVKVKGDPVTGPGGPIG
jgi:hypothetical protein